MAKVLNHSLNHVPGLEPQQREASLTYLNEKLRRNPVWLRLLSWVGLLVFFGALGLAR